MPVDEASLYTLEQEEDRRQKPPLIVVPFTVPSTGFVRGLEKGGAIGNNAADEGHDDIEE